jgi:hypothetical protein
MQFRTHDVTYRRYAGLFFSQYVLISLIISWYTWKCIHLSRYWKISSAMSVKLISVLLQQGNMGNGTSKPTTLPHTPLLGSRENMEVIWAVLLLFK